MNNVPGMGLAPALAEPEVPRTFVVILGTSMNGLAVRIVAENRDALVDWINKAKLNNFVGELIPVDIVNNNHGVEVINLNVSAINAVLNEVPPGPKPAPPPMGSPGDLTALLAGMARQSAEEAEEGGLAVLEIGPAPEPDDDKA